MITNALVSYVSTRKTRNGIAWSAIVLCSEGRLKATCKGAGHQTTITGPAEAVARLNRECSSLLGESDGLAAALSAARSYEPLSASVDRYRSIVASL